MNYSVESFGRTLDGFSPRIFVCVGSFLRKLMQNKALNTGSYIQHFQAFSSSESINLGRFRIFFRLQGRLKFSVSALSQFG